jgi:hypothetical protein
MTVITRPSTLSSGRKAPAQIPERKSEAHLRHEAFKPIPLEHPHHQEESSIAFLFEMVMLAFSRILSICDRKQTMSPPLCKIKARPGLWLPVLFRTRPSDTQNEIKK